MASRRGNFGRAPRVAPSLTNTLVAIAREMQNQRDSNIMSAWQKGGMFEGAKVTDTVVLNHWRHRLDGISKDDPLYDTYKNAVSQYEYSIAESKMTVQYAQGHISDQAAASFYLNWAKKVPKDSEFYRVLQRDAAQYMRASKAKSDAAAAKAKELAYQKDLTILGKGSALDNFLMGTDPNSPGVLLALAQRGDADHHITQLIGGPGTSSSFNDFASNDPEQMLRLLAEITPAQYNKRLGEAGGTFAATKEVLFTDNNGKSWTGQGIVDALKALDPKFDGRLNLSYVKTALAESVKAVDKQIALAQRTGHLSDVNGLRSQKLALTTKARQVNAWPVAQDYEHLKSAYEAVMGDVSALAEDKDAAWTKYQTSLRDLANDPRIAHDDAFRSALVGEADQDPNTVTIDESFTRFANPEDPNRKGDVVSNIDRVNTAREQTALIRTGAAYYTQGDFQVDPATGGKVFVPNPNGKSIGAATLEDIQKVDPGATPVLIPTAGKPANAMLTFQPVKVTVKDAKGESIVADDATSITHAQGYFNGHVVEQWGFKVKGVQYYSAGDKPPFDTDLVKVVKGAKGVVSLDASAAVPTYSAASASGTPGVTYANRNELGVSVWKANVTNLDAVVLGSDKAHNAAGIDPSTDHRQSIWAFAEGLPPADGQALVHSQSFRDQAAYEANVIAGLKQDPKTGEWTGTLDQQRAAQALMVVPPTLMNASDVTISKWDRYTSDGLTGQGTVPNATGQATVSAYAMKLPGHQLGGTAFDALGKAWKPNTNIPDLGGETMGLGPTISTGINLRIPGVDLKALAPKAIGPATPAGGTGQPYVPPTPAPTGTPAISGGTPSTAPAPVKPPPSRAV